MRAVTVVAFLSAIVVCSSGFAQQWASKMFESNRHDFGTIARGAKAEYEFRLTNLYVEDVHIASVRTSCGCTSPSVKDGKRLLKTHETGAILARINSDAYRGTRGATLTVTFDRPFRAEVQLHVKTHIRGDVVVQPGSAQLGSVAQGAAAEKLLQVSAPTRSDFRILEVRCVNPHISGTIAAPVSRSNRGQTAYQLRVRLAPDAPAGYVRDQLVLVTNDHQNRQVHVLVEGRVRAPISISPTMLFMGVLKPGEASHRKLVVQSEQPFIVRRIISADDCFAFDTSAEQGPKRLHVIPVSFIAGDEPGEVFRAIRIETDQGAIPRSLLAQATITAPDGRIPERSAVVLPPRLQRLVDARKTAMIRQKQQLLLSSDAPK